MREQVIHGLRDLIVEIPFLIGLYLLMQVELLVGVLVLQLIEVDGLDDDAVGHSFAGGEAAAVIFDDVNHVVGVVVPLLGVGVLLAEGDDDAVLEVVEDLAVVAADELEQLVLELGRRHLLEDERGLREHGDGLQRVVELGHVLRVLDQLLLERLDLPLRLQVLLHQHREGLHVPQDLHRGRLTSRRSDSFCFARWISSFFIALHGFFIAMYTSSGT